MEARELGVLVAVISGMTPPLFREFIYYVRAGFDLAHFETVISTRLPELEIQTYVERDRDWDVFRWLKNSVAAQ